MFGKKTFAAEVNGVVTCGGPDGLPVIEITEESVTAHGYDNADRSGKPALEFDLDLDGDELSVRLLQAGPGFIEAGGDLHGAVTIKCSGLTEALANLGAGVLAHDTLMVGGPSAKVIEAKPRVGRVSPYRADDSVETELHAEMAKRTANPALVQVFKQAVHFVERHAHGLLKPEHTRRHLAFLEAERDLINPTGIDRVLIRHFLDPLLCHLSDTALGITGIEDANSELALLRTRFRRFEMLPR